MLEVYIYVVYTEAEAAARRTLAEAEIKKKEEAKRFIESLGPAVKALDEYQPFANALATLKQSQFQSMTSFVLDEIIT
jgi:hypothetical protein